MATMMSSRLACAFLLLVPVWCALGQTLRNLNASDWWEQSGFYQIYPRSFKDSDGDGIGDLNGITQKLPYLKSLGIKAFWLSPIYKSPMADFGYDIANFRDIQPEYGTMANFENLVKEAKSLGLKVILDFVPNHTSDEHEWFVKSENREAGYEDYYVWHDGKPGTNLDQNDPPNNWVENFYGSAWKWSDKRQQYYLHQFHRKQPDLNYRNPKVVEEMKEVLRFWLRKGVDGFRIDAVNWLFEDTNFQDEPFSGNAQDPLVYEYLNHIYTQNLPETVDMVYQWRAVMDEYKMQYGGDTRVLMTEAWSDLSVLKTYFEDENGRQGSQMPFNFQLILRLDANNYKASDFKTVIDSWLDTVPVGQTPNWVLGNHDRRRVASRMGGVHMTDIMEMVQLSIPGVSVTYQGEEIGMTDYELSWADTVDPAACLRSPENFLQYTRDPARTPFQWDNTTNAGFTNHSKPWLPVSPAYVTVNVQAEEQASWSHLKVFKALMELRERSDFRNCHYQTAILGTSTFAILRTGPSVEESEVWVTVVNLANSTSTVNVAQLFKQYKTRSQDKLKVVVRSVSSKRSGGDMVSANGVVLQPYEGLVLRNVAVQILVKLSMLVAAPILVLYAWF
ncbi:maltase 2-like [Ochlerotatus camptorhynchus]|uniref:maltase 2-like n=1 Tax=Ochlerotatus camptorhynchus TaxID=644619 RepID=UPI0031D3CCA3